MDTSAPFLPSVVCEREIELERERAREQGEKEVEREIKNWETDRKTTKKARLGTFKDKW